MRTKLRLLWYWLETRYAKLLRLFGVVRSTDCIPDGMYCYEYDEERNAKEPADGYWLKTCKYYRSTPKTKGIACTYVGYMGFDPCLYDQCKICDVNIEQNSDKSGKALRIVSHGRIVGKTRAMVMGIKATIDKGGKAGVVGCKDPQPILDRLKALGTDAQAEPMVATGCDKNQTGFVFYCV